MEKWRIKIVHLGYFGFILSLIVFMSIGCGGGSSGSGGVGGGSGTTNPAKINDDTPAGAQGASIEFNSAGDAMAVWISYNGGYYRKILYSLYTQATGTWSNGVELGITDDNPVVCSDGTDFMVLWAGNDIYAREYVVSSGTWGAETIIESQTYAPNDPHVASNGTGYCAVWSQPVSGSIGRIYANVYNGSTWGTETAVDSGGEDASSPRVASNDTGYCVTWQQNDLSTNNIYANVYEGSPMAWVGAASLEAISGYANDPQVASDGVSYCVTWQQNDGALVSIYANIYTGGWVGATTVESSVANNAYRPTIASDGSGYYVVWYQLDGGSYYRVYGNIYTTPSWGTEATIDSGIENCYNPEVAANSSGYGVTWYRDSNICANIYDGSWGTEMTIESGSGQAIDPYVASDGTGYGVVWVQNDGSRNTVYANLNNGSGWGTESNLTQNQYHGSVTVGIRFAANNDGDVLAIWRQYENDRHELYGCLYTGGAWGNPFQINDYLYYYDVSSNGNGFMIVYNRSNRIYAVPYDATTGLGTEVQISGTSSYGCRITSDGHGYCAAWSGYDSPTYNIYANLYSGSSWEAHATLAPIHSGPSWADTPQIASNGTGYCVTWEQNDGAADSIFASIFTSTWVEASLESNLNSAAYPQIASNGTGYCVTWEQYDGAAYSIFANVYTSTWSGASSVESGSEGAYSPQIASNGTSYGVTWHQWDGSAYSIYANLYDGLWGTEVVIESGSGNAYNPRGASNGTGYCVSWGQDDGTADSAYVNTFDGSTWGTEQVLESSDTEVIYDWDRWINVVAVQDTYTIGWIQEDVNDSHVNNAWAYSGLSD